MVLALSGCHAKHHKLSDLNARNLLPWSSGGWEPKIKESVGWFLLRILSLAYGWLSSHGYPSVHIWVPVSSDKDTC